MIYLKRQRCCLSLPTSSYENGLDIEEYISPPDDDSLILSLTSQNLIQCYQHSSCVKDEAFFACFRVFFCAFSPLIFTAQPLSIPPQLFLIIFIFLGLDLFDDYLFQRRNHCFDLLT